MLGGEPAGVLQLQQLILRAINLSVGIGFMAVTVVLLYAGVKFITSNGDPKNLLAARQAIIWALLGIVAMALAWIVLRLVQAFTGVDVTHFCLGFAGSPAGCK